LLDDGLDEVVLLADHKSFSDVILTPLTGSPVEGTTLADDPVKCPTDLLHGSVIIISVAVYHINIIKVQVPQRVLYAFDDVFSGQSSHVGASPMPMEYLGG
jgi:hypothetical protein